MTYPLTVGDDTLTQAGLITFPKEIEPFLLEGHTFTIEGCLADGMADKRNWRIVAINLSVDVFGDEDETPTNPDTKE